MVYSLLENAFHSATTLSMLMFCVFSCSDFTSTDQQPRPLDTSADLSVAEKVAGEWTFTGFCKPIEFYNVLLHRPVGTLFVVPIVHGPVRVIHR